MQKILSKVRNLDLFARPVSLSYKGKTKFSTFCGGCFSFVIILTFLTYSGLTLHGFIVNPVLKGFEEKMSFSYYDNTDPYNITTKNSTLAV